MQPHLSLSDASPSAIKYNLRNKEVARYGFWNKEPIKQTSGLARLRILKPLFIENTQVTLSLAKAIAGWEMDRALLTFPSGSGVVAFC